MKRSSQAHGKRIYATPSEPVQSLYTIAKDSTWIPLEAIRRFRQGDATPKPWDGDLVQRIASNDPPPSCADGHLFFFGSRSKEAKIRGFLGVSSSANVSFLKPRFRSLRMFGGLR